MRDPTDELYDCLRELYPPSTFALRESDVGVPGLGNLLTDDLGDGRGKLTAMPGALTRFRPSAVFYFVLGDRDSLCAAARDGMDHLRVQAAHDQRSAGPS